MITQPVISNFTMWWVFPDRVAYVDKLKLSYLGNNLNCKLSTKVNRKSFIFNISTI